MKTIFIMAGTTEGRTLTAQLQHLPVQLLVSTATDYGAALLPVAENLHTVTGKRDKQALESLLKDSGADCAIDATHPYAVEASTNLAAACAACSIDYIRLYRRTCDTADCIVVSTPAQAAEYLSQRQGNVLLTIGSNGLDAFCQMDKTEKRYFARVLPLPSVLEKCNQLGFDSRHVVAMQGPFSQAFNVALLREINAKWMVTKESGKPGGFEEKRCAARQANVGLVVIGRPKEKQCDAEEAILAILEARYSAEAQS